MPVGLTEAPKESDKVRGDVEVSDSKGIAIVTDNELPSGDSEPQYRLIARESKAMSSDLSSQPVVASPSFEGALASERFPTTVAEYQRSHPVSDIYVDSVNAFHLALTELRQKYSGLWVAFHGNELVGAAETQTALYVLCRGERGLRAGDFYVARVS